MRTFDWAIQADFLRLMEMGADRGSVYTRFQRARFVGKVEDRCRLSESRRHCDRSRWLPYRA
jgi:hypothetical protein